MKKLFTAVALLPLMTNAANLPADGDYSAVGMRYGAPNVAGNADYRGAPQSAPAMQGKYESGKYAPRPYSQPSYNKTPTYNQPQR